MENSEHGTSGDQINIANLISLKEAAELSGLSYSHMRYLARNQEFWVKKLGRDWFTTEEAVQEYLARDRRPGPKPKRGSGGTFENS